MVWISPILSRYFKLTNPNNFVKFASKILGQLEEFILLFLDIPRDSCRFMPTWKLAGEPDNLARRNFSSHAIPDNEPMDQNDAEMYDDEQETGDETNDDINMPE